MAECAEPGASVAAVALAYGLNTNLVHKWRRGGSGTANAVANPAAQTFLPVAVAASTPTAGRHPHRAAAWPDGDQRHLAARRGR